MGDSCLVSDQPPEVRSDPRPAAGEADAARGSGMPKVSRGPSTLPLQTETPKYTQGSVWLFWGALRPVILMLAPSGQAPRLLAELAPGVC